MMYDGDVCCRYCPTIVGTREDLEAHRRGGYCHLPTPDPGYRIPFTSKSERTTMNEILYLRRFASGRRFSSPANNKIASGDTAQKLLK